MNQSLLSSPMTRDEIEQLRQAMQAHCFQHAPAGEYFTLTSGRKSRYYYNGKMVTLHPRWRRTIGDVLAEIVLETRAEAVGGMALGACPIADAVSDSAYLRHGTTLPVFIVRPAPKGHGTREEMAFAYAEDGRPLLTSGRKVAIVDDVITTGGSIERSTQAVEALGCQVVSLIALVERHERGGEALKQRGYNFRRLFYTNEEGELFTDDLLLEAYPEAVSP